MARKRSLIITACMILLLSILAGCVQGGSPAAPATTAVAAETTAAAAATTAASVETTAAEATTAAAEETTAVAATTTTAAVTTTAAASEEASDEPASFKWYSLQVDRRGGFGIVEETLLNEYRALHPNVDITVETLENETYKTKLRAYIASNDIPDMFYIWTTPTWFDPLVAAGSVAVLDTAFFEDPKQGFKEIALLNSTYDGVHYAVPSNSEFYMVYYNKTIFEKYGIAVPNTFDELLEVVNVLRSNGVQPCSTNGKEVWGANNLVYNMTFQYGLDVDTLRDLTVSRNIKFSEFEPYRVGMLRFMELIDAGFFDDNWLNADYSEMYNLFIQGQTAMLYMSSGMADLNTRADVAESVKGNIDVFLFPAREGDKGTNTDMTAQYIAGYALSSKAPQAAHDFLYWYMDREHYAKHCWEISGLLTAQDVTDYATVEEMNSLKGKVLNIQNDISNASGLSYCELSTATFRSENDALCHSYWSKMLTIDEFLDKLDESADNAALELAAGS